MINNIVKAFILLIYFFTVVSCSNDNCSDTNGSPPPYETIAFQFIDQNGKNIQLDNGLVNIVSADQNEIIDNKNNVFSGLLLGNRNPIQSNKIDITYNNEKILELDYKKQKKKIKCNGDYYLITKIVINSLSENYKIESQSTDSMYFNFIIRIIK